MNFKNIQIFIDAERRRLHERYGQYSDKEKETFAMAVKCTEEVGELCEQVLFWAALQGKHKKGTFKKENLEDEFADVLFATLVLARQMDVDILAAAAKKAKKIEARYKNKKSG